jgi:hypothetical protein
MTQAIRKIHSLKGKPKKPAVQRSRARAKKQGALSREALRLLVATSKTPKIFDEPSDHAPFEIQDR